MVTGRIVSILGKESQPYVTDIMKNMKAVIDAKAGEDETKLVRVLCLLDCRGLSCLEPVLAFVRSWCFLIAVSSWSHLFFFLFRFVSAPHLGDRAH